VEVVQLYRGDGESTCRDEQHPLRLLTAYQSRLEAHTGMPRGMREVSGTCYRIHGDSATTGFWVSVKKQRPLVILISIL